MELPVYTGLLRVERRLGQFGDMELPRLVTLPEAGAFAGTFLLMLGLGQLPHPHFALGWSLTLLFGPPALVARFAGQPVADRKPIHLWALSQLRYFLVEPRVLAEPNPTREPAAKRTRFALRMPTLRHPVTATPVVPVPAPEPATEVISLRSLANWQLEVQDKERWLAGDSAMVTTPYRRHPVRPAWSALVAVLGASVAVSLALGLGIAGLARMVA